MKSVLDYFGYITDPYLGIEISSTAIKILQISKRHDGFMIEHYATQSMPAGSVVEGQIKEASTIKKLLQKTLKDNKISARYAAISIPNALAITRVIQISAEVDDKDIGIEVELEADKYIPYALSEVNYDYQLLGINNIRKDQKDVLLVAAKREHIAQRLEIIESAGLKVKIIDINSYAASRAFSICASQIPEQGKNKVIALFDIGSLVTTLNVFNNMQLIYSREQIFGGNLLVEEIQNRYGLSHEDAILASSLGDLPEDYATEVLSPFQESLVQQLNRACQFYYAAGDHKKIDAIALTGGTASIPDLCNYLQAKLNIKTLLINPFASMQFAPHINKDELNKNNLQLLICCGTALRNCFK